MSGGNRRRPPHRRRPFLNPQERRAWAILIAIAGMFGAVGWWAYKRSLRTLPKPAEVLVDPSTSTQAPALTPRAGLEMQTVVDRVGDSRRITLELGGGSAVLTLGPSEPGAGAVGEGTLTTESSEKGAAFANAVSHWLSEPLPPARATKTQLKPLKVQYLRLAVATSRAPEAFRLTLIGTRRRVELFFNLYPLTARATFLERGRPETRPDLTALLAEALRDGPKPLRTKADDPNMSSDAPLASTTKPLQPLPVVAAACGDHGVFAASKDGFHTKIVAIPEPGATPRTLTTIDGVLEGMSGSPDGKQLALLLVNAPNPDHVTPEDPRELLVVDTATGKPITFFDPQEGFRSTGLPVWTSSGALAVDGRLSTTTPGDRIVRAYGKSPAGLLGETEARQRFHPTRVEGDQVVLVAWENQPRPHPRTFLWTIGKPPVARDSIPYTSPDGRFVFTVDDDRIVMKDGHAFSSADVDDRAAIREVGAGAPIWLGKHLLGVASDVGLGLDLETLRVRPVVSAPNMSLVCATSDQKHAVLLGVDGSAVVADLATPSPQ
jgi:hypothetical protein